MVRNAQSKMLPTEIRASISLASVYALRMLGMFLVLPVLALYAAHFPRAEHHQALIGLSLGIYGLTQALLQLPLGIASDRFGRKKIIYIGLLVFALGSFLAASATTLTTLVIARAIQGAGAVSAAITALLTDVTRDEVRTRAMSMIGLSIGLTFSISLVLAPMLNQWIGVEGIFTLTGILTLLAIAVVHFLVPNPSYSNTTTPMQAFQLKSILKNPQLMRLNFGIFSLHSSQMALFIALPFILVHLGLPKTEHWYIYLPSVVIGLIAMVPLIIVGETRGKLKTVFIIGISCLILTQTFLAAYSQSIILILCYLILYFIGFNVLEASLPSMVSKIAPDNLKGTAMGVYNTCQSIGLFVGGISGGLILQYFGLHTVFAFCAILLCIWLIIAIRASSVQNLKTLSYPISHSWHHQLSGLENTLLAQPHVQSVSLDNNQYIVHLKVTTDLTDTTIIEQIISGEQHVNQ